MPRRPRLNLTGLPLHIIQRGNNRSACFFADEDYRFYLHSLRLLSAKHRCAVHAYVLMTNHVHLLLTPADPTGASRLMQAMGRHYVPYVNQLYKRTGTLCRQALGDARFREMIGSAMCCVGEPEGGGRLDREGRGINVEQIDFGF